MKLALVRYGQDCAQTFEIHSWKPSAIALLSMRAARRLASRQPSRD